MTSRQYCTPHIVSNGKVSSLKRFAFEERRFDESWFQKLLFNNPSLLPVDEIEPLFGPLMPLARELSTAAGPVDLVYINAEGYLTLVETKLWRNPEARRQVVAQIIDYATAMSKWSYQDLCDAVRKAGGAGEDPVAASVAQDVEFDLVRFVDTVSRELQRGRFLLLIVGDGIHEGVEHLAHTLSESPHLRFSLALVELAMFRTGKDGDELVVQPRTLAKTREMVRAVVELKSGLAAKDVVVTLPATGDDVFTRRREQREEIFLEKLAQTTSAEAAKGCREFLASCESMGIERTGKGATVGLYWVEPNSGERFTFGSIYAETGWIEVNYVPEYFHKHGVDSAIASKYLHSLAALVPGATIISTVKGGKNWVRILRNGYAITFPELLPRIDGWLSAIQIAMQEAEAASAAKIGQQSGLP